MDSTTTNSVLTDEERQLAQAIAARSKSDPVADAIIAEVAAIFDVSIEAIKGERRLRRLVDARSFIAVVMLKRHWTLEDIGELLNRDHSTIANLEQRMRKNSGLRSIVEAMAA